MEFIFGRVRKPRKLKAGFNMFTATMALATPFTPDTGVGTQDDFFGRVARHWSETVDNGLEGTKKADF